MIKLTLDPEKDATSQSFEKPLVILGSTQQDSPAGTVDIILKDVPNTLLLKIQRQEDSFTVENVNKVSDVCINHETFESREIHSGDRISIGSTVIDFEGDLKVEDSFAGEDFDIESELEKLDELFPDESDAVDRDLETLSLETIDQLLEEVDALDEEPPEEEATEKISEPQQQEARAAEEAREPETQEPTPSAAAEEEEVADIPSQEETAADDQEEHDIFDDEILDDIELEFDDSGIDENLENAIRSNPSVAVEEPSYEEPKGEEEEEDILVQQSDEEEIGDWRNTSSNTSVELESLDSADEAGFVDDDFGIDELEKEESGWFGKIFIAAAVTLIISGVIGLSSVLVLRSQNGDTEIIANRAVADVSMALVHAKAHALLPYNNNPMDRDFLEENLLAVLSPEYRSLCPIASETGLLEKSGYQVQIVASTDLSRFLVIALPNDGLRQTLAPLPTIILSSESMQLRRSYHLQQWQNLVHEVHSLDEVADDRISVMLRDSEFIRLAQLEDQDNSQGFLLPKEFTAILPEANDRIYNAPRYFVLTESLVTKIIAAAETRLSQRECSVFQQAFNSLSRLPFLVMYTSEGPSRVEAVKETMEKARWTRIPQIGYVVMNPENNLIQEVHILVDSDMSKLTAYIEEQSMISESEDGSIVHLQGSDQENTEMVVDPNHPLFVTLTEISSQRQQALTKIGERITRLVEAHNRKEVSGFFEQQQELLREYQSTSRDYQAKIARILTNLYRDYVGDDQGEDLATFMATVKATDLESLLPPQLNPDRGLPSSSQPSENQIESLLQEIPNSSNLTYLDKLTKDLAAQIDATEKNNPSLATSYRNRLRNVILRKVGDLLLSPQSQDIPQTFQEQNRSILNSIFDNADISDLEERQFYLNEFDLLMDRFRAISHQTLQELQKLDDQIVRDLEDEDLDVPYRMNLERQHEEVSQEIAEQRATVVQLKNQMSYLPINTATTSSEEQQQNLGRLGQQVLIQASLKEPSASRDDSLREAIALLVESTNENRSLWEDILEARRLLTETPKQEIVSILESDLGFDPDKSSMAANIRNLMTHYINDQQALLNTQDEEHYQALYEAFRDKQSKNLEMVISTSGSMESQCRRLSSAMDEYVARLEEFQSDYQRAKDEGFFYNNRRYHSIMAGRLRRKLASAKKLKIELDDICQGILEASGRHRQLCELQLSKLQGEEVITADTATRLLRDNNSISYPNLLTNSINEKLTEMIEIGVYPVSQ